MAAEGITFKTGVKIGKDLPAQDLVKSNDAVLLCAGSTWPRDLPIPGKMEIGNWLLNLESTPMQTGEDYHSESEN